MSQQPHIDAKLRSPLPILNDIRINNPCSADWDSMTGTERERHCAFCDKSVHDLERHTAAEAVELVTDPEANVCVRMLRDPAGNVVTSDSPSLATALRRDFLCRLALLAASFFGLSKVLGSERKQQTFTRVSGSLSYVPPEERLPRSAQTKSTDAPSVPAAAAGTANGK